MALSRRGGNREPLSIWPGFVDAFTTLLLLLMFVLTIFLVVQFALRDTITTQVNELDALAEQVAGLADALGLERGENARLTGDLDVAGRELAGERAKGQLQQTLIANLNATIAGQTADLAENATRIASFEAQVAGLLADRDSARGQVADLEAAKEQLLTDQQALNLALAKARTEVDAQAEAARLAAAEREAIEALLADLRQRVEAREASLSDALARLDAATGTGAALAAQVTGLQADLSAAERQRLADQAAAAALQARLAGVQAELSDAEKTRLVQIAAAEALREKLRNSQDELTAMTLALEQKRTEAEDTLTLLAAANAARQDLNLKLAAAVLAEQDAKAAGEGLAQDRTAIEAQLAAALAAKLAAEQQGAAQLTEAERQAALLSTAQTALSQQEAVSAEAARAAEVLNQQVAALRGQLGALQSLIDAAADRDSDAKVEIQNLGGRLNSALATVLAEQTKRAKLEEAERKRLEAEARNLEGYRSEFFGKLRTLLADKPGVQIVGDRFVFSSEVLFAPGSADLSFAGQGQIAEVVRTLQEVIGQIPPGINWMIRVDGHTDNVPLSGEGAFASNWELSQGRALSVVLYMINVLGFPPDRVAATGFGEYQPVAAGDSPQARAQNRRIELKLTER